MPTIAIIERGTWAIASTYEDEAPNQGKYGGPWGWPEVTLHVQIPDGMDKDVVRAVPVETQVNEETVVSITFEDDPDKVEVKLQQLWVSFRADRNRRLAETDWAMTVDSPLSSTMQTAVREYRQALRDLPTGLEHPSNVVWPASPL